MQVQLNLELRHYLVIRGADNENRRKERHFVQFKLM